MRGYNAIYVLWEGFGFPNNTQPSPGAEPLTFEEWFARLEAAGVTRLRTKFCGWNGPLGTSALSFEPKLGVFNDWGGRLEEAVVAALAHGITFQVIPFDNEEWRSGWPRHAWNAANGGFLSDPRKVFTDPRAIAAAKARIDAVAEACGDAIGAWEVCAEMSFLIDRDFWGVDNWTQMQPIVREALVPWVEEMAQQCIAAYPAAPVGNGQVFAPAGFNSDPNHPSRLRNEVFMTPSLDFALTNWYGDEPVRNKLDWLRSCQQYIGKPIYVEQYAPWDLGPNAAYTRETADFASSRVHEWAAACGEYGVEGPLRWPEIKPVDEFRTWWGVASPEMAEIAGTTRWFSEAVDLDDWTGRGRAWEEQIASTDLAWAAAWGDGAHVTAFLTWLVSGTHGVSISGLENQEYEVRFFDWLNGDQVSARTAVAVHGILVLEAVPYREDRTVLCLSPVMPVPPEPEPERRMNVVLQELEDDQVVSTWAGELQKVPA